MDDVLDSLNSFSVTGKPNNVHAQHPRFSQFKSKHSKSSQEERRKSILAARKLARYDLLNHIRNVELCVPGDSEAANDEESVDMEGVEECYRKPKYYKDFVMLSEWLVDVPVDFASQYSALPVPVGKRCLVVSGRGRSRMYGRNGSFLEEFLSVLPGGSPITDCKGYAIVDCIVSYEDNVFYVIDTVAWSNQSIMQCETLFRFEWTRSRIEENEYDLQEISENNYYVFKSLPWFKCDQSTLQCMMEGPQGFGELPMDGIMFYHNESHYTHGPTPLVNWLRPYMMPEILNVPVPERYMSSKPEKYVNLLQHIEYGKEARQNRFARNQAIKEQKKAERQKKHEEHQKKRKTPSNTTMMTEGETSTNSSVTASTAPEVDME